MMVFVKCLMQFPLLCAYYTGESSVEVKTEADSNDITEHPHDDKPRLYLCTVCDKQFKSRPGLRYHKLTAHSEGNSHLCTCLLYTSPSPRDGLLSRMPSSA